MFGLSSDELDLLRNLLIERLKKAGAKVWIFGSRARGDHGPFSDIDILYQLPSGKLALSDLSLIREALEESHLPYKVDVVAFDDLAQSYVPEIIRDRKSL